MNIVGVEQVHFGPFSLSLRQRTLATQDGPVAISSRAFDVLVALIESRHCIVSKDDLMRRVWSNLIVEENNLHVQIAATRRALGAHHTYIVTVPGRGYRFVGDLHGDPGAGFSGVAPPPPEAAPTNLPALVTALIGREPELNAACAVLGEARLVTLVGPGGVGKTKLALATARAVLDRFTAGGWLVELESVAEAALVPGALAASLRIEELAGRSLMESTLAALRQRHMLLVLDGCEHVLAAAGELAAQLLQHCPDLRILCTSQAPLGIAGEQVRRIAPFDVPDADSVPDAASALDHPAVRLFAERAAAGDDRFALSDAMVPSVLAICRSLDGIPLAIELAAARVPLLGLEPVRLRIANRLALLADGAPGRPERHYRLRAAIEWSHGLLPELDRQILRRLGVFAGGFTLEAAQDIAAGAGVGEADIVRGVGNLVRRSLLTTGPDLVRPRHRMLEAMRDFGLEALVAAGEHGTVAQRHAAYFCGLAEAADAAWETADAGEWMAKFAAEFENFRAALGWALAPGGDAALGARLAAASARLWFEGGHLSEGRGWLTRALAQAPNDLAPGTLMWLKRGLAELSIDAAAAVFAAGEAVALAQGEGPATEGVCLRMLSAALYRTGKYQEAEAAALRAYDSLRGTDRERTFARCLGDLGILRGVAGDYAGARRYTGQARTRLKTLGDDRGEAICLQYAAEFEFHAGELAAAIAMAEDSVTIFRTLNSRFHLEIGLGNLAAYLLAGNEPEAARQAAAEALTIAGEIEDQPGVVIAIEHTALALALLGAAEPAARLLGFVEAAHRQLGLQRQETEQAMHNRLLAALGGALHPERQADLTAEGRELSMKAAARLAAAGV